MLAFHLGRPLDTILEWENFAVVGSAAISRSTSQMPEEEARDWPQHLGAARLEEVMRTRAWSAARRDHAVVVLRTVGRGVGALR